MKYTDLTEEQLADNFERVAQDFYKLIEDNGLEKTEVDMGESYDERTPERNLCNTPACHGGWAAIMYNVGDTCYYADFYEEGAKRLAEELGFISRYSLENWADEYPEYWGGARGKKMFMYKEAFGKDGDENLCLIDIPNWYMEVAKRLRA